ncbi:hypothetical protein Syun_002627 [Stephania yunnanensis]|uniref:Uncharacterized protein n=1 Tax=Stephania yunnanensis TaxID=152371 RepID=A0AAP0LFQ0_9MAGN
MPRSRFAGSLSSPKIDVVIDMGNPFLNHTVDGFLKIGAVNSLDLALSSQTSSCFRFNWFKYREFCLIDVNCDVGSSVFRSRRQKWPQRRPITALEKLKKMCQEGAYWGAVAGVYVGSEYGIERIRGTRDWKNAMLGGALTGALVSAASNNDKNKIILDAITGGAVATAAEFINYLT